MKISIITGVLESESEYATQFRQSDLPLALLMSDMGLKAGQPLFVLLVVSIRELVKRLPVNWPVCGRGVLP